MSEPEQAAPTAPEFIHYVRERDKLREDLAKVELELAESNVQLYETLQKLNTLERSKAETPESNAKAKTVKKPEPKKKSPSPAKPSGKSKADQPARGRGSGDKVQPAESAADGPIDGVYHPPIPGVDLTADTCSYYWSLAESFPTLPMFQVLDAERKFMKADTDSSGSIDRDELDKVLTDTVTVFTPAKVDEIFREIDSDNSGFVDFYEVLVIVNKLSSRRRTNLPVSVQQNYSKTCTIQ